MEFSVGIRPQSQEDLEQLQQQGSPEAVTSLSKAKAAHLNDNRDSWLQAQYAVSIPRTLLAPVIPLLGRLSRKPVSDTENVKGKGCFPSVGPTITSILTSSNPPCRSCVSAAYVIHWVDKKHKQKQNTFPFRFTAYQQLFPNSDLLPAWDHPTPSRFLYFT